MKSPFIIHTSVDRIYGGTESFSIESQAQLLIKLAQILTEDRIANRLVEIKIEPQENYE